MSRPAEPLALSSVRALLAGAIDYAGLFPPASLDMATVAANYRAYRAGGERWSLGRLVVPAVRLAELFGVAREHWREERVAGEHAAWRVSALAGADAAGDAALIAQFNARCALEADGHAVVDSVESRGASVGEIEGLGALFGAYQHFVELPVRGASAAELDALLGALRATGAFAKIRMGGVVADAFPAAADVARFLAACARAGTAFKATAGLHHPVRGAYRLTYAPDSVTGTMYGYVNLFVAAARAREGASEAELVRLLEARASAPLAMRDAALEWDGVVASAAALAATRESFALAFGSCSFREPLDDLETLLAT